jgi:hypothetical protein
MKRNRVLIQAITQGNLVNIMLRERPHVLSLFERSRREKFTKTN